MTKARRGLACRGLKALSVGMTAYAASGVTSTVRCDSPASAESFSL